jgi:hypothetical protein
MADGRFSKGLIVALFRGGTAILIDNFVNGRVCLSDVGFLQSGRNAVDDCLDVTGNVSIG